MGKKRRDKWKTPRVFISYAYEDRRDAQRLAAYLQAAKVGAFLDTDLSVGEKWSNQLSTAIEDSDWIVVLMSPAYFSSRWAQAEVAQALALKKQILPIMVEPCEVKGPLQYIQWLDASHEPGGDPMAAALRIIRSSADAG